MSDAPAPSPAPAYILTSHLPCGHCGYDLVGFPIKSICPECSHPISESLNSLYTYEPRALRVLEAGARVGSAGLIVALSLILSIVVTGMVSGVGDWFFLLIPLGLAGLTPWILARGWWLLSSTPPPISFPNGRQLTPVSRLLVLGLPLGPSNRVLIIASAAAANVGALCLISIFTKLRTANEFVVQTALIALCTAHLTWSMQSFMGIHLLAAILRYAGRQPRFLTATLSRLLMLLLSLNAVLLFFRSIVTPKEDPGFLGWVAAIGGLLAAVALLASLIAAKIAIRAVRRIREDSGGQLPWSPVLVTEPPSTSILHS